MGWARGGWTSRSAWWPGRHRRSWPRWAQSSSWLGSRSGRASVDGAQAEHRCWQGRTGAMRGSPRTALLGRSCMRSTSEGARAQRGRQMQWRRKIWMGRWLTRRTRWLEQFLPAGDWKTWTDLIGLGRRKMTTGAIWSFPCPFSLPNYEN